MMAVPMGNSMSQKLAHASGDAIVRTTNEKRAIIIVATNPAWQQRGEHSLVSGDSLLCGGWWERRALVHAGARVGRGVMCGCCHGIQLRRGGGRPLPEKTRPNISGQLEPHSRSMKVLISVVIRCGGEEEKRKREL